MINRVYITLGCVCHASAKARVQNMTRYNGAYGCSCCFALGETHKEDPSHTRSHVFTHPTPKIN